MPDELRSVRISSLSNSTVSTVRKLYQSRKWRGKNDSFLADTWHVLEEAARRGVFPEKFIISDEKLTELKDREKDTVRLIERSKAAVFSISGILLKGLSGLPANQGFIALFKRFGVDFRRRSGFSLYLDGISNPGNVGTIVRSAAAGGFDGVFISEKSADAYGPEAVRASAGAIFSLPVFDGCGIEDAKNAMGGKDTTVVVASSGEGADYAGYRFSPPCIIVLGNEKRGASIKDYDGEVNIPLAGGIESLSVPVAAGILIFHIKRLMEEKGSRAWMHSKKR